MRPLPHPASLPAFTCVPSLVAQFAGAYFMTLLYGVLPPVMVWQLRRKAQHRREQQPEVAAPAGEARGAWQPPQPWWQQHSDMVPGGAPLLAGLFSAAVAIQLSKLALDAGLVGEGGTRFLQVGPMLCMLWSPACTPQQRVPCACSRQSLDLPKWP